MPGYDSIFGNLPLAPGYQAMPTSPNIEDRREQHMSPEAIAAMPSRVTSWSWSPWITNWLHPVTGLGDPSTSPLTMPDDPAPPPAPAPAQPVPYWMQPNPLPNGPRSGPRFGDLVQLLRGAT